MAFINGSCKCNAVQIKINEKDIKRVLNCHCNLCKSINGGAFSTYVIVFEDGFHLVNDSQLHIYRATETADKAFCKNCGTPIYNSNPKYHGIKIVYLGILENKDMFKPQLNIYCESKLDWVDHINNMSCYSQGLS